MDNVMSITSALPIGQARFNQAAAKVTAAASAIAEPGMPDASPRTAPVLSDAMVEMVTARYAMQASLKAAQQANDMMMESLKIVR